MFTYFEPQEFFIEKVWLFNDGNHYKGNGFMIWKPDEGFHIMAHIKNTQGDIPIHKEIRSISFDSSNCLYMKLGIDYFAIAPTVFPNEIGLIHGQLTVNTHRVIFIQRITSPKITYWSGSALYQLNNEIILPDTVTIETKIGEGQPRQRFSRAGVNYSDESGIEVIGYKKENKYLEWNWKLPIDNWRKDECWKFAKGLRSSISILSGQILQLKYREIYRTNRIIREVISGNNTYSLGMVLRPYDKDIIDKQMIIDLAIFFTRGGYNAEVSKKIYDQISEAARQRTDQGQELLLSTILEATLRSLYRQPFVLGKEKTKFRVSEYLKKLRQDYLTPSLEDDAKWKKVTSKALRIFSRLRHRNAHPDWLSSQEQAYSVSEREQTTNDMIFLSRFYGFIILGLANKKVGDPKFPVPVAEWGPLLTITKGKKEK
jgi:hypothetical protein